MGLSPMMMFDYRGMLLIDEVLEVDQVAVLVLLQKLDDLVFAFGGTLGVAFGVTDAWLVTTQKNFDASLLVLRHDEVGEAPDAVQWRAGREKLDSLYCAKLQF